MSEPTKLYRHFDREGVLLYVGVSLNALQRLAAHRNSSHWFNQITRVEVETLPSREEALVAEREAVLNEKPKHNVKLQYKAPAIAPEEERELIRQEDVFFTDEELCSRWQCGRMTIYRMRKSGRLPPPIKIGGTGRNLTSREKVIALEEPAHVTICNK